MKKLIVPVRLSQLDNPEVAVPVGAVFRMFAMEIEQMSGIIQQAGQNAQAVKEIPTLLMEVDPDITQTENRHYRMVVEGTTIEGEELTYLGTSISRAINKLIHLYEVK